MRVEHASESRCVGCKSGSAIAAKGASYGHSRGRQTGMLTSLVNSPAALCASWRTDSLRPKHPRPHITAVKGISAASIPVIYAGQNIQITSAIKSRTAPITVARTTCSTNLLRRTFGTFALEQESLRADLHENSMFRARQFTRSGIGVIGHTSRMTHAARDVPTRIRFQRSR